MVRLLHMNIGIMCRRYKYIFLYVGFLFVLSIVFIRLQSLKKPAKSYVNLQHVAVHIDLKGSPPKLTYLSTFLPSLNMYGVDTLVMEYEDMFPYNEGLINLSSINAYKRNELSRFLSKANALRIQVIPLIQTFGHMEFALKLKEFAHLRELDKFPGDICPSHPETRTLLTAMLKQVIDLHSTIKPLQHIHIGCDEVSHLNKCPLCLERRYKNGALYLKHVEEVTSIVKKLSPFTKVLLWGDMLHELESPFVHNITNYIVEPVEWQYGVKPKFSNTYFYNVHKNYKNMWVASAFKGADGKKATIPNIKNRFLNHLSWMKFLLDYKFGGESKPYTFEGIILTGWSRYTHMAPQCELLPLSVPSLVLNLLLIRTVRNGIDHGDLHKLTYCEFYHKYLSNDFKEVFRGFDDIDNKCAFENTLLYIEHDKLFDPTFLQDCQYGLHESEYECRRQGSYVDVNSLHDTFLKCKQALTRESVMKESMEEFMSKYYKAFVIKSYIDEVIQVPARDVRSKMIFLQDCTKNRVWGRRF